MEIKFSNYEYKNNVIDLEITGNNILGITGNSRESLAELISLRELGRGNLEIDNLKLTKDTIMPYRKKISVINKFFIYPKFRTNVYNYMNRIIKNNKYHIKNCDKKIKDSLKIVGLERSFLEKEINTLSTSELRLLQYSVSLISNPEIIVIHEPFKYFDKVNTKKILMVLERLKEQFNIKIIMVSEDSEILYKYTDYLIITKTNKIVAQDYTNNIFKKTSFLKKNKIDIPEEVEFTSLALKNKNAKIEYHKDVRDIIKDIYKHV